MFGGFGGVVLEVVEFEGGVVVADEFPVIPADGFGESVFPEEGSFGEGFLVEKMLGKGDAIGLANLGTCKFQEGGHEVSGHGELMGNLLGGNLPGPPGNGWDTMSAFVESMFLTSPGLVAGDAVFFCDFHSLCSDNATIVGGEDDQGVP